MISFSGILPVNGCSGVPFDIGIPPKSPPDWREISGDFDRLRWNRYRHPGKNPADPAQNINRKT